MRIQRPTRLQLAVLLLVMTACFALAQRWRYDRRDLDLQHYRERHDLPSWKTDREMPHDLFTFVRIEYSSWGGRGRWATDFPDADLNFSHRLQELTSMNVHPDGLVIELTDPRLFDHPFIYIVEPGELQFTEDEVQALRRYLLNGGFLMVDDFWGEAEWDNFYYEFKRVFPDREPRELPLEHPIFHAVFPLEKKPQIPAIRQGVASRYDGVTWERHDAREVHYRGVFDDQGRMMAIICHNTDLGDGWEREGENHYYFKEFSEKWAYPLGINIVFYALTH